MQSAGTALQLDEDGSSRREKSRLLSLKVDNSISNEGLNTKQEITETPETVVTSAEKPSNEIEEISSSIIAGKFRDFLISQKGVSEDQANDVMSHLEEFIDHHVPEIGALQILRQGMSVDQNLPTERYTDARKKDPDLTPMKWFDAHYRKGAVAGIVSARGINEHDGGFTTAFSRAHSGQFTLGETIIAAKAEKRDACKVLLGADEKAIARFLEVMPNGGFLTR